MSNNYDAIVIGAGMGGLSVATYLAKHGLKTLLLEKHNVPGGYGHSFVRGRFEFEVALHVLSDMGTPEEPGTLREYLDSLGVTRYVDFVDVPSLYRSVFPDLDMELPTGKDAFVEALCERFPDDANGIRRFINRVLSLSYELDALKGMQKADGLGDVLPKMAALPFKLRKFPRYMFATWEEVLKRDVKSLEACAVLSDTWGYYGLPPSKVAFIYFAIALGTFLRFGASHIQGRAQALSSAFLAAFNEHGGEARMSCGVEKVTTENGKATGVITETGEEFTATYVISNADPVTVSREMIGEESIPKSYFKTLQSNPLSPSCYNVYLGVAKSLDELGITDHEIILNEDFDFDKHYEKSFTFEPPGMMILAAYNTVLPTVSPPGTSVISLCSMAQGETWSKLPPEEYVDRKNQIGGHMLDWADRFVPGLRDAVETVEVSTPITNMRFASTLGGSMYGFNNFPHTHTVLRPGFKGPLKNLFYVGAWSLPGGGFSPSMFSGQMVGKVITMTGGK